MHHDSFFVISNWIEAGLWFAIGLAFFVRAWTNPGIRRMTAPASLAFVAFGVSDIVETHTGAWWRPVWLLIWKATCVGVFACLLWKYVRSRGDRTS